MANEYLVNSADMTAVADAIRAKGGTSEALAFPGGFVEAVSAIQAGGYNNPWILYDSAEIVVGENAITNMAEAQTFMLEASGLDIIDSFWLLNNITTNNQLVFKMDNTTNRCMRWRNGEVGEAQLSESFDAVLVPGTRYIARKMTIDTKNTNPY